MGALGGDGRVIIGIDDNPLDTEEMLGVRCDCCRFDGFMGMFLLDTAVAIRYMGIMHHISGYNLTLDFSRLFQKSGQGPAETISNIAVYVPFGFFLGEALAEGERWGGWRLIGKVTLAAFSLSLFIECLQLVLHVGFFELTDLVLNTVGAGVGAGLSAGMRGMECHHDELNTIENGKNVKRYEVK